MNYVNADDLIKPDTRTPAQKWLDAEMDKRNAQEQGAEQHPILEAIALQVIKDNQRLRKAIKRACKGYPEDDTAPTCVAILRAALNVGANRAAEGGPVERPVRPLVEKREDDDA